MVYLTINVDNAVLRRARIRALQQGTSVNAVLRTKLEQYAGFADAHPVDALRELAERHAGHSDPDVPWTREELHLGRLSGG